MLKLRLIGIRDYSVLEDGQRIGRIRLATEHMPASGCGASPSTWAAASPWVDPRTSNTAKAEFKTAWKALKARTPPEDFAAAYKAMNIRDDG